MIKATILTCTSKGNESMIKRKLIFLFTFILILVACSDIEKERDDLVIKDENLLVKEKILNSNKQSTTNNDIQLEKEHEQPDLKQFNREPVEWGENVTGVKTNFQTDKKEMALTFDACGGDFGSDYDEELITFLRDEQIPATLFVNEQWIHVNEHLFLELASDPLFQIENHGTNHAPLSINGGEAWGINATKTIEAAHDEIMTNHKTVKRLIDKEMTLFRSGTAYYDEVAVELANTLGYEVVNFDILGDAGATYSASEVKRALLQAKPGSIALLHMNQPTSDTADGIKQAIPLLREQGFKFILLENKVLQ